MSALESTPQGRQGQGLGRGQALSGQPGSVEHEVSIALRVLEKQTQSWEGVMTIPVSMCVPYSTCGTSENPQCSPLLTVLPPTTATTATLTIAAGLLRRFPLQQDQQDDPFRVHSHHSMVRVACPPVHYGTLCSRVCEEEGIISSSDGQTNLIIPQDRFNLSRQARPSRRQDNSLRSWSGYAA